MTSYVFETMTADQAANFTGADTLVFSTATLLPSDVVVSSSNNGLDLTSLTAAGKTLVFSGQELFLASGIDGNVNFTSAFIAGHNDGLFLGSFGSDNFSIDNGDDGNIANGFYGNDNISGNSGADVIFGGGGSDFVDGAAGNDHIYGFALTGTAADDGGDLLHGGSGNDYIQGNAGNDIITGDDGNDRLNGGNNDDHLQGGNGNDTINGNKGDDTIRGDEGNDSLRGGAGDDSISGGNGNDVILGDLGNDIINGGGGIDVMTGGAGADTFIFFAGDATFATTGTLAYFADTITDFTHGTDQILLDNGQGTGTGNLLHAQAGIVLTSVAAALTYAQQLLDAHAGTSDLAVLEVGSDAYLFYGSNGAATIDSIIKLAGVDASSITAADLFAVG